MMKVRERVLVLSLCLIVVVAVPGILYRLAMDQDSWRPNDIYNSVGGSYYSSASVGSSSSDGVAVSVRGGVRSSRRVAAPVFLFARNANAEGVTPVAYSQSPMASGQGLYTTSSHMAKSFGSGLAVGVSPQMQTTRSAEQVATSVLSVPSLSAYSMPDRSSVSAASQAVAAASYTPIVSTVSAVGADAAPVYRGFAGRRAPGTGGGGTAAGWNNWLNGLGVGQGYLYEDAEGNRYYDMDALKAYFENNKDNFPGWTWEQFLEKFFDEQDKHRVPLGEAWVLLAMALGYALVMWIRSRRVATKKVLND